MIAPALHARRRDAPGRLGEVDFLPPRAHRLLVIGERLSGSRTEAPPRRSPHARGRWRQQHRHTIKTEVPRGTRAAWPCSAPAEEREIALPQRARFSPVAIAAHSRPIQNGFLADLPPARRFSVLALQLGSSAFITKGGVHHRDRQITETTG